MVELFKKLLMDQGVSEGASIGVSYAISMVIVLVIGSFALFIAREILLPIAYRFMRRSKSKWDDTLIHNKVLERAVYIVPLGVIQACAVLFPDGRQWIERIAFSGIVFVTVLSVNKLMDAVNEIYGFYKVSKIKPITGYLQVVKIAAYIVGGIVILGVLMNRSPWLLLGGLGAASAVLLLIFQGSIQGLVAGILLSANDMVRLGDWIEMPQYGADGDVIEITLNTVKVRNWDQTITTIPTHSLISESFKNWRGMQEVGGRRIKRAVYIDMNCVKFLTEEMLERYKNIDYIQDYLEGKIKEIEAYNQEHCANTASLVNGRHLTNIGTFRAYLMEYIKRNPNIHQGMTKMVRQLEPTEKGLPIEVYVFAKDTAWVHYEGVQADLFDHILAILPEFDLRVYQNPTGNDLIRLTGR